MINLRLLTLLCLAITFNSPGQTICTAESRHRLDSVLQSLANKNFDHKAINEVVVEIGMWFINTPYVEKTLELPGDELLVINLVGLDCTTYVETIITLARLAKMQQFAYEDYERALALLRYRDGNRDHYPSRLHYFSDWIYNNQEKGLLKDITREAGGITYENRPSFMSSNPKFYPQLSDEANVREIKKAEEAIMVRDYYYIPKRKILEHEKNISPGDLIAITIDMDNLDVSHVGIAVEQNSRIHLMHASSKAKKVVISEKPLSDYLIDNKKQSGIMVCRLIDLR